MKFLVPNYSCLQNPWLGGLPPPDPRSLCPLSPTEFVEHPRTKFLGTPLGVSKKVSDIVDIYWNLSNRRSLWLASEENDTTFARKTKNI